MQFRDLAEGQTLDFGQISFSKEEIIAFGRAYDPIPFHVDPEAGSRSAFGRLIASGAHPFHVVYLREWIPRFKDSVFAGRGINDWKMHAPVFAQDVLECRVTIRKCDPRPERGYGIVEWYFTFKNQSGVLVQELVMTVLHHLNVHAE